MSTTTTLGLAVRDSITMSRRSLRRLIRYPALTVSVLGMPLVFLLLFVFVFGETMGAGIGGTTGDRTEYLHYVVPGILVMSLAGVATSTAISIAMDMSEGIIARFKTMPVARVSVLTGHVVGAVLQSLSEIPSRQNRRQPLSGTGHPRALTTRKRCSTWNSSLT
jgi:ABC-2 type transport system permease protein